MPLCLQSLLGEEETRSIHLQTHLCLPTPYIMPCKHSPVDPPQSHVSFSQKSCAGLKLPSFHLEMHSGNVLFETLGPELCSYEIILPSPRIFSGEKEVNQAFAITCLISYHVFKFIIPAFLPVLPSHVLRCSILLFLFLSQWSFMEKEGYKRQRLKNAPLIQDA